MLGGWTPGPCLPGCKGPLGGLPGNECPRAEFFGPHRPYSPHNHGLRAVFSFKPLLPC